MKWRSLEESRAVEDSRSLREIFAERKELIAKYVPAENQQIHRRVVEQLVERGVAEVVVKVGDLAPTFELENQHGTVVSSQVLLSQGPLAVIFFRGRWCPFCVAQLEATARELTDIQQAGSSLVAISPQTVKQSFFMADQHRLNFPLLSDTGNQVARRYGLTYPVPRDQIDVYRRAFVNLPLANGDNSWELPIPAVFVVDRSGIIRYAAANADYTDRPEPKEIVGVLREIQ